MHAIHTHTHNIIPSVDVSTCGMYPHLSYVLLPVEVRVVLRLLVATPLLVLAQLSATSDWFMIPLIAQELLNHGENGFGATAGSTHHHTDYSARKLGTSPNTPPHPSDIL